MRCVRSLAASLERRTDWERATQVALMGGSIKKEARHRSGALPAEGIQKSPAGWNVCLVGLHRRRSPLPTRECYCYNALVGGVNGTGDKQLV